MKLEDVKIYDEGTIINRAYLGGKLIFNRKPIEYSFSGEVYCGDIYCGDKHIED